MSIISIKMSICQNGVFRSPLYMPIKIEIHFIAIMKTNLVSNINVITPSLYKDDNVM